MSFRLKNLKRFYSFAAVVLCAVLLAVHVQAQDDPLPSWNNGSAKQAIIDFVKTTTDANSSKFVPPKERIAEFDQDGTLWVEQPGRCWNTCRQAPAPGCRSW